MRISYSGLALVKQFEGFRATAYYDAAGLLTIGYGHLLSADERAFYARAISEAEAEALLLRDIAIAERAVRRFVRVPLQQHQFDALVSFTFNLGAATLQRSILRRVLNGGDYDAVPGQLMRYVFAGGRKLPGLIRRRAAEAALYSSL